MNKNLKDLMKKVETELEKAEKNYKNAKRSAQEIAASAAVLALKHEVEEKGEQICFEHEGDTVFVVDSPVLIPGFKIVSSKSPLGQKILFL